MAGLAGAICSFSLTLKQNGISCLTLNGSGGLSWSPSFPRKAMSPLLNFSLQHLLGLFVIWHAPACLVQHWRAINMEKNLNLCFFSPWSTLNRITLVRNKPVLTVQCHCPYDFSGAHIPWSRFLCPAWGPYHILQHPWWPRVPTGPQHELLGEGPYSLREPSRSSIIKLSMPHSLYFKSYSSKYIFLIWRSYIWLLLWGKLINRQKFI